MKTAVVTGVSRGIGKAIAQRLVKDGFFVHGTYNTGESVAKKLREELQAIEVHQINFSKRSDTLSLIDRLKNVSIDVLVNNAAVFNTEDSGNFDAEQWDSVFEVNLNAPVLLAMKLQHSIADGGVIINISSTDGYTGSFNSMSYAASKAALNSVTKSLANVLGARRIRVVGIAPGWISGTGMNSPVSAEAAKLSSLERNGTPEEIANAVSFLASTEASFITGSTITIDGGYTCVDYIMKKEAGLI